MLIFARCSPAVQHQCIPQAILGMDVLCQAKSGMGKTAVFVLSVLQQLEPVAGQVAAVIICHTRELAFQVILPCFCLKSSPFCVAGYTNNVPLPCPSLTPWIDHPFALGVSLAQLLDVQLIGQLYSITMH